MIEETMNLERMLVHTEMPEDVSDTIFIEGILYEHSSQ